MFFAKRFWYPARGKSPLQLDVPLPSVVGFRNPHGVGTRIHEYRLIARAACRRIWLLPLWDDTPWPIVCAIERRVIRLLDPTGNRVRHHDMVVPVRSSVAMAAPGSRPVLFAAPDEER